MDALTTFTVASEFERATSLLDRLGIAYEVVSPQPAYGQVGCPALVLTEQDKPTFLTSGGADVLCAGWVDYRSPAYDVPGEAPREFVEDIIGRVAIVLLAPCVADLTRLRLTAHFSGDVAEAMPYLNAVMPQASYMANVPVLSFMDGHRMVSLYRDRIAIAKADDILDAWASLERLRCLVNDVWTRRADIVPSSELRRRPSALEIYKRLPGSNCRDCGEPSCTAFAWAVWRGDADARACRPVFAGEREDLREALLAVCPGLGLAGG